MEQINNICSYFPKSISFNLTAEDTVKALSSQAKRVIQNINRAALPIIVLTASMLIQQANAGPFGYAICVGACGIAAPPAIPVCVQACLAVLAAPTP